MKPWSRFSGQGWMITTSCSRKNIMTLFLNIPEPRSKLTFIFIFNVFWLLKNRGWKVLNLGGWKVLFGGWEGTIQELKRFKSGGLKSAGMKWYTLSSKYCCSVKTYRTLTSPSPPNGLWPSLRPTLFLGKFATKTFEWEIASPPPPALKIFPESHPF